MCRRKTSPSLVPLFPKSRFFDSLCTLSRPFGQVDSHKDLRRLPQLNEVDEVREHAIDFDDIHDGARGNVDWCPINRLQRVRTIQWREVESKRTSLSSGKYPRPMLDFTMMGTQSVTFHAPLVVDPQSCPMRSDKV